MVFDGSSRARGLQKFPHSQIPQKNGGFRTGFAQLCSDSGQATGRLIGQTV